MNLFAAVHARFVSAALVDDLGDATHAQLTPAALAACLDSGAPVGGMTVVVAGDRLSPTLHDRAAAAGVRVHHYYGASELSFVAWGSHAGDLQPFPAVDVELRAGEIWVRSPYLCEGYAGQAGPFLLGEDGYATVGDRGTIAQGRLVVDGRPDTVTVGGATVETTQVETLLRRAAVGDLAVVGLPHQRLGSLLAVVLTAVADHEPVRRLARAALHGARRPRLWFLLDALPTTPAGKVDRRALVSLLSGGTGPAHRLV